MTRKPVNENAIKALEGMKLEIAKEVASPITANNGNELLNKNLAKMEEKQFYNKDKDTFYPI